MPQKCPKCGATLPDTAQFCTVCGTPLKPTAQPIPQPTPQGRIPGPPPGIQTPGPGPRCPTCGCPLRGTEQFCTRCGTKVAIRTPPPTPTHPQPPAPPPPPSTPTPPGAAPCPNCGGTNPPGARYCIHCGQALPAPPSTTEEEQPTPHPAPPQPLQPATPQVCPHCGAPTRENARFCVRCGHPLLPEDQNTVSTPTPTTSEPTTTPEAGPPAVTEAKPAGLQSTSPAEPSLGQPEPEKGEEELEEEELKPLPVPPEALEALIARGRQLAIEEQYAQGAQADEELLAGLSEAAVQATYPLEDLIDTYIQERSEQEKLEALHESGEVSDQVYDRLSREYHDKLTRLDQQIREETATLRRYLAQLSSDLNQAQEALEALEVRIRIGDTEGDPQKEHSQLTEQIQRLSHAINAAKHILAKEAALHGAAPPRFQITETPTQPSEESSKETEEKPAPQPQPEAGKICPVCGFVAKPGSKYCPGCGGKL